MCVVKPHVSTRSPAEALAVVDEAQYSQQDPVLSLSCPSTHSPASTEYSVGPKLHDNESSYSKPTVSRIISNLPLASRASLKHASEAADVLRRKLVRGSKVLIIQGGYSGKRFIYERLKELEVHVTIMDGPDTPWRSMVEEGILDGFIELDFSDDHDTLFRRAMTAIENSKQSTNFDACCTYFEDAVCLSAKIATALGLGINSIEACENARNKRRTREVMAAAGLPAPRFHRIIDIKDVPVACATVGFPAILKPVFGAASIGVTRVDNEIEAVTGYNRLLLELDPQKDTIWTQGNEAVLEEFYDGDEFDIDLLLSGSEVVYAKVSDNCKCLQTTQYFD